MYSTGRPTVAVAGLIGDVYARMRAAASGELVGFDVLEPVRVHPELWEIKWKPRKLGEFRMYHAEPGGDPELVGLRFHRKDVRSGDRVVIRAAQEAEMALAATRYSDGVSDRWGHERSCRECV